MKYKIELEITPEEQLELMRGSITQATGSVPTIDFASMLQQWSWLSHIKDQKEDEK